MISSYATLQIVKLEMFLFLPTFNLEILRYLISYREILILCGRTGYTYGAYWIGGGSCLAVCVTCG